MPADDKPSVKGASARYEKDIVSLRRHLHRYPELSGEERETSKTVCKKLEEHGIPYTTGYAGTGVLGVIEGGSGGTVALRADMDALPIREENDHDFVSENPGVMHACGHDAHTAMLVGVGCLLSEIRERLPGRVLLVFQPAEEMSPTGGAQGMMDDGVFAEYWPDAIFAQHVRPNLPVGQVGVRDGPMTGNSDRFKVVVEGAGGHASSPHQATDVIVVTGQLISALQNIISRNVNPLRSAVLTIGRIEGGERYNVIAKEVTFEGTIRTLQVETKESVKSRLHTIVEGIAASLGARARVQYWDGYPATVNTPEWAECVRETAREMLGDAATPEVAPTLGGEDFSRFLLRYPGAFYRIGTARPDEEHRKLHDSRFDLDESALGIGVELMAQIAIDALYQLRDRQVTPTSGS